MSEIRNRAMTGIRPTGDLTIANYVGAMAPIVGLQTTYDGGISIFVADLHGLTDQEPDVINANRLNTARSLIASGVDPTRTTIYLQSELDAPTEGVASILDRHITVAELSRVPTLKEKLRNGAGPESATVSLFRYPTLMAADILVQDATHVPVGEDQRPHIEITRDLARRFNNQYGETLVTPQMLATEGLRILSLDGNGKMSKSIPKGAIFLNDTPDEVARKVKSAQSAKAGEMNDALESHFKLVRALTTTSEDLDELDELEARHQDGAKVMGQFKEFMTDQINDFLTGFQERYRDISDREVVKVLLDGSDQAYEQAADVHTRVKSAMGNIGLRHYMV